MTNTGQRIGSGYARTSAQFWVLASFLLLLFAVGGSSQRTELTQVVLQPVAIIIFFYALVTVRRNDLADHRVLVGLGVCVFLLHVSHLIQLPPVIWHRLPGREVVIRIDELVGAQNNWRPISMVPEASWSAFYSLSVPLAAGLLALRIDHANARRLLGMAIALIVFSGFVELLQSTFADFRFYRISTERGGLLANHNHQAVLLSLLLPMVAAYAATEPRGPRKRFVTIVAASIASIAVPLVLVTGSRAGLLTLALSAPLAAYVVYAGPSHVRLKSRGRFALVGVFAVGFLALLAFVVVAVREHAVAEVGAISGDVRLPLWESASRLIPKYLPWGSGIGTFAEVYQINEPDALLKPQYYNRLHNDYLETIFATGILGGLILIIAGMSFFIAAIAATAAPGPGGLFGRLGVAIVAILAVASVVDYPVSVPCIAAVAAIAAIWVSASQKIGVENGLY